MDSSVKQLMLTAAWLFARHGQWARARCMLEAVVEQDPHDGVPAAMLAELLLDAGEAEKALSVVFEADFPAHLRRAEAVLETRALRMLGRGAEADSRWSRYVAARKGANREWVTARE